ncbi:MAG: AAA family ATPase [Treponema sp.]|nr:AAA family ATPase [Treponema sp.]
MFINTKELFYILDNTPASQNIMLIGKHGIGKSRILEEYYAQKGQKVVTLFLGQMSDPGDLIGLPEKNLESGKTDFMLPYWFPSDGKPIVLFLDELNRARPELLQTIMDLALNRKLAGKELPQGSRIISAVNAGNEYQLTELDPALVSRFNIYNFQPSVEDWLDWAQKALIDSRIIDFIKENPQYLDSNQSEIEDLERSPDRRSWERTSQVIEKIKELGQVQQALVSGIIGDKATGAFFNFLQKNKLPGPKEILLGDVKSIEEKLSKENFANINLISSSLFDFIENTNFSDQENIKITENLRAYFKLLEKLDLREIQASFVSKFSAKNYPKTLNLISKYSGDFYKELLDFIDQE